MYHNKPSKIHDDFKHELTNQEGSFAKFMFNSKNLRLFTKHNIDFVSCNTVKQKDIKTKESNNPLKSKESKVLKDTIYKPFKKDSLFWCFFILKHGFSKYEMEVGNQQFSIEKQEKFKYIDELRKTCNKDLLKMHKIKPLSLLEDDLANQERISIKTFFALCIVEKINVMLIDKRKVYEILITDDPKIHIIHRNSISYEHHIELDVLPETINMYRETYYKMTTFDASLKSMASYKVEELLELCKKLDISLEPHFKEEKDKKEKDKKEEEKKKKLGKKDIYELIVQQF
jgi:hypothetical protein